MSDPIPGNDPHAAYEVTPIEGGPKAGLPCDATAFRFGTSRHGHCRALRQGCRVPRQPDRDEAWRPLRAGRTRSTIRSRCRTVASFERWQNTLDRRIEHEQRAHRLEYRGQMASVYASPANIRSAIIPQGADNPLDALV